MAYFGNNKQLNAAIAAKHTEEMKNKYAFEIGCSVVNTKIYQDIVFKNNTNNYISKERKIIIDNLDSTRAIMKYCAFPHYTAVLNFSSYKNPGGQFLNGSMAQEEALCHESFLYNVLREFDKNFYDWNRHHLNKALYLNRGLFSPDIKFFKNGKIVHCNVITCAAPNKTAATRYQQISDLENKTALEKRIKFVLDIAKENDIKTLILGAYGCGVFGQNPAEVASIFKEYLKNDFNCFDKVIFAIPKNENNKNYEKFIEVFCEDE